MRQTFLSLTMSMSSCSCPYPSWPWWSSSLRLSHWKINRVEIKSFSLTWLLNLNHFLLWCDWYDPWVAALEVRTGDVPRLVVVASHVELELDRTILTEIGAGAIPSKKRKGKEDIKFEIYIFFKIRLLGHQSRLNQSSSQWTNKLLCF